LKYVQTLDTSICNHDAHASLNMENDKTIMCKK